MAWGRHYAAHGSLALKKDKVMPENTDMDYYKGLIDMMEADDLRKSTFEMRLLQKKAKERAKQKSKKTPKDNLPEINRPKVRPKTIV